MEMTRRHMFAAASAAAVMTFPHTALGGWEPSERYPDPAIKSLDPSFNRYRLFNASIERLATGNALVRRAGLFRRRPLCDLE
jgi:gluconolactonase